MSKPLSQRATKELMRVINRRDRNTRGLAKVVSAHEYLLDNCAPLEAVVILNNAKFALVQERRNLNVALWDELNKQRGNSKR
jgi:hypothetical protein